MKTPISLIEGVIGIVHDVLGTRESFERHEAEVSDDERAEICERIGAYLTPEVEEVELPEITEDHAKFLVASGCKVKDAQAYIEKLKPRHRAAFFAAFAAWQKEQKAAPPANQSPAI